MTESMIGITAIMPLRNGVIDHVRRAVGSLAAQTCPKWHLRIVVERADEARLRTQLAAELADPRVRMVRNEGRRLAGAFNTGMRNAPTQFVAILLADDMWAGRAVEVLLEHVAARPEIDFFHSARVFIDEEDRVLSGVYPAREAFTPDDFVVSSPVKHLLCWRVAKALSIGGMDESLNFVGPDDYDFPWSMAEHGAAFMAIQEPLYLYRDHRQGPRLTTHVPRSVHLRELRRILTKHGAPEPAIRRKLHRARSTYLRQCLYRNRLEKWVKERFGYSAPAPWRERYRSGSSVSGPPASPLAAAPNSRR